MAIHLTPEANPTVQEGTLYVDSATGEFNVAGRTTPHIIPGVLYPAVAGKLLDGTTTHGTGTYNGVSVSTNYGTTQSDGRMYYRTDIKGSRPIKDPRIGAHFGSQRHEIASIQLLEQETATHGSNVYSIDGRNWMRCTGGGWSWINDAHGSRLKGGNVSSYPNMYIEVVGYFNGFNLCAYTDGNHKVRYSLDGGSEVATDYGNTSAATPLGSRFVDPSSVVNIPISTTLGIHTIKLRSNGAEHDVHGIELIAQDTTSTANRSKIQIPSQNVVSYGKKFNVSGTPHYDPFNGFTSGNLASVQALGIDTATSLGLSKWLPSDAGTTYYRPFNGGRVVKWVDSSGAIKTSVNMMPPNAKSIANSASPTNAFATRTTASHFGTNNAMNSFEAGTDLDSDQLSEVAKTFLAREIGNGGANGNGTLLDASSFSANGSNIAYVLDDGLTSLSATAVSAYNDAIVGSIGANNDSFEMWFTFIGTGISFFGKDTENNIALNLPYGTHILHINHGSAQNQIDIDGVRVFSGSAVEKYYSQYSFTIFQPKKPPIPEDACVIADYMLMADFVPVSGTANHLNISKGVRWQSSSRDVFADESDGDSMTLDHYVAAGYDGFHLTMDGGADSDTSVGVRLPFFGTNWVSIGYQHDTRFKLYEGAGLSSTDKDSASTKNNDTNEHSYAYLTSNLDLGTYVAGVNCVLGQTFSWYGFQIATPIHTSSHYQPFETPYLNELVGGDRNMEQTNLVCSPDGKTWDEVTKDTSYIGNIVGSANHDGAKDWPNVYMMNKWRGTDDGRVSQNYVQKDFAIAYDRIVFLRSGDYKFHCMWNSNGQDESFTILKNGVHCGIAYMENSGDTQTDNWFLNLQRGDYVQVKGAWGGDYTYTGFWIERS